MAFCNTEMMTPITEAGYNLYDIGLKCEDPSQPMCYPEMADISAYLNQPKIRSLIGVDPALDNYNFTTSSPKVNSDFERSLDMIKVTNHYVASLLEHGVRVLIYVGTNDFICNHVGNAKWLAELDWSGKEGFVNEPLTEWFLIETPHERPRLAGKTKSYRGLSFITINGGAHAVRTVSRWPYCS